MKKIAITRRLLASLFVFSIFLPSKFIIAQTTVTYTQQTSEYDQSLTTSGSGGIYNNGATEVGMWMNGDNSGNSFAGNVLWKTFRVGSATSNTARSLQVGDEFRITVATKGFYYGTIGVSLNSGSVPSATWANRTANSRLRIQQDGSNFGGGTPGSWYYHNGSGTSFNITPTGSYVDYAITVRITGPNLCNVTLNGTTFNDVTLGGTADAAITHFSIFMSDDRAGVFSSPNRGDSYWKQTTTVVNQGNLPIGGSNNSFTITSILGNGLAANSTSTSSTNSLTKSGSGNVTLSGANTYSGGTTINAGTLSVSADNNLGNSAGNVTLGGGTLAVTTGFSSSRSISSSNNASIIDVASGQTFSTSGILSGSNITKNGSGTLTLSSGSSFGGLTVGTGVVRLNGSANTQILGNSIINSGATLRMAAANQLGTGAAPPFITVNGTFDATDNSAGNFSQNISLSGSGSITMGSGTLTIANTGTDTYSGTISGTGGIIKANTGSQTLSGANTSLTGGVQVQQGILVAGNANAINSTNTLTLGNSTNSGTFRLNGNNITVTGITTSGSGASNTIENNNATSATLTVNNSADFSYSGILQNGASGTLNLSKSGAGNLTLSGANTYTGSTIITNGALTCGIANALPVGNSAGIIQTTTTSGVTLNLGLFNLGTSTATANSAGQLDLDVNTTINLGSTGTNSYYFKASNGQTWGATTVTINNWTGTAGQAGTGRRIYVGASSSGLTSAQLASISFTGFSAGGQLLNTGELVPAAIPIISSISASPNNGTSTNAYNGSTITVQGNNFESSGMTITMSTGGTVSSYTFTSSSIISFSLPIGYSGTISITNSNGGPVTSVASITNLGYISNAASDWTTASTWLGNSVPPAGATVTIANAVTVNGTVSNSPANVTVNAVQSLTFGASGDLTVNTNLTNNGSIIMSSGGNLRFAASATFANGTSTFTGGTGTVTFNGAGTVSGTISFNHLTLNGALTNSTTVTVNGNLTFNAAAASVSNAPTYGASSTLIYTASVSRGGEWSATSGTGYPVNVIIQNGATLTANQSFDIGCSGYLQLGNTGSAGSLTMQSSGKIIVAGNLTIGSNTGTSTLTLSSTSGGDIKVGGNWTRTANGTFTDNSRAIFFTGSGTNVINATGGATMSYLVSEKTGGSIQLGSHLTVNAPNTGNALSLLSAASFDLNGNNLNLTNATTSNIQVSGGAVNFIGTGTINISGAAKTISSVSSGTASFASGITVALASSLNPGSGLTTINGTLQINSGGSVSTNGFTLGNSGVITSNTANSIPGTVTFSGAGTINGIATTTFNNLTLNGTATFTTAPAINGTLTLNSGASVASNAPTYGASSTLVYATAMTEGLEWPSASGPQNVTLNSSIGTVTLSANVHVNGGTLTINSGATLDVSASNFSITLASGSTFANSGTFTARSGTVTFSGSGTISGTNALYNVTIAGGVNFGTASTIGSGGSLQINSGGFVNTNPPSYNAASTLIYNTTGTYGRGLEWSATSGAGYPGNVTISNNTTLNIGNNGTGTARQCAGTLTINSGSTFSMNESGSVMTAAVTVVGNVVNNGGLTLSASSGGDLYVAGNFTNNGTFTHNSRAVFFNGTSQTISGSLNSSGATNSFAFVRINSGSNVTLAAAVTVNNDITFNSGKIILSTFDLTLVSSATITSASSSNYIQTNSTGQLRRVVTSSAVAFPVGNSSYNPITLTNSGTSDTYGIRVTDGGIANANDNTKAINRSWLVTEAVAGGSNLTPVVLQYGSGDVGTNYNAGTTAYMGYYDGSTWTQTTTTLAGANPYTATSTGASQFPATLASGGYFAIGKDDAFTGTPLPTISSFTTSGYTGSTITIRGANLTGASAVSFGGVAAASYTVDNATQITATVGAGTSGSVSVTTPGGTASLAGFTYLGYVSNNATDWNTASTWLGGNVPPASSNVTIAHAVTLNSTATNTTFNNLTINSGASLTFGSSGAITIAGTLSNSGSVVMTSGGSLTMAASATLANGTSTFTAGVGTVTFAGAGTVSGTIAFNNITINGIVALSNAVTVNGNLQINTSGGISTNAPIYGSSSTLIYNSTANPYNVATEWTGNGTTAGAGIPQNVTILNTNNVTLPSADRGLAGNLLISAGTLTLNTTSGSLYVAGNFTQNSNFTSNGQAVVVFNGSSAQSISGTGSISFFILSNRNTSGGLTIAKDITITGTTQALRVRDAGALNIGSGVTLTLANAGAEIFADGAQGGTTKTINFNASNSRIVFSNTGSVTNAASGTLSFTATAAGGTVAINDGVNFGNGGITTFGNNTVLQINAGGYVNTNAPVYATGSTLQYNGVTNYVAGSEWYSNIASGTGVPHHVTLTNATLNFSAATQYRQCNGNFTLSNGSVITLSTAIGGDLRIGGSGNWVNQNTTVGNGLVSNNRALMFVGNADQQMSNASGTLTVGYLLNSKTGGNLILNHNLNLNGTAGGTAQVLQLLSSSSFDLNGRTLTIAGDQARSILVNGANRSITGSVGSEIIFASGASAASIDQNAGVGTLSVGSNVKVTLNKGVDFGSSVTTINGSLQINSNGSCNTNPPVYGAAATLIYAAGNYTTSNEWTAGTSVGAGVPYNVTINLASSSNTVTLAGNRSVKGALTFTQGKLTIGANILSLDGTLSGNGIVGSSTSNVAIGGTGAFGTFALDNSTPGTTNLLNNFTINRTSSGTITLGGDVNILGFFTPTAGAFTFNGNKVILKSTAIANTGQVGVVGAQASFVYNGSDGIQVERFLNSSKRGYRNIASGGVISNAYIFENWQEGGSAPTGYGTHITGLRGSAGVDATTGLDKTISGNSSLWTYNTSDAFVAITNTKTKQLLPFEGYFATIRGDRNYDLFAYSPDMNVASTILRTTGKLCYGTVTLSSEANPAFGMSGAPSSTYRLNKSLTPSGKSDANFGYSLIANPYPCAVNWGSVYARSNGASYSNGTLSPYIWVWQQQANSGNGAWVTIKNDGTVNVGGLNINEYLQPGQSVFIQNDHSGNPVVVEFQESDKYTTDNSNLKGVFGSADETHKISVNLLKNIAGTSAIADGTVLIFSAAGRNNVTILDAPKMSNTLENVAVMNGNAIAIESRALPTVKDTIALRLWNLTANSVYRLSINAMSYQYSLQPYLYDKVAGTKTALIAGNETLVTLDSPSVSTTYSDRYYVVFEENTPLPMVYSNISASKATSGNKVEWTVDNSVNQQVNSYVIEASSNGRNFEHVGAVAVKQSNAYTISYQFVDVKNTASNVYYRVKAITATSSVYSKTVYLGANNTAPKIAVYPTMVKDNLVNISLQGVVEGSYDYKLLDAAGKVIATERFVVNNSATIKTITLPQTIAKGNLFMHVTRGNDVVAIQKIIKE